MQVDLDAEEGRPARPAGIATNVFRLVVRPTKTVNLAVVQEYLRGNTTMSKESLEGLSM